MYDNIVMDSLSPDVAARAAKWKSPAGAVVRMLHPAGWGALAPPRLPALPALLLCTCRHPLASLISSRAPL